MGCEGCPANRSTSLSNTESTGCVGRDSWLRREWSGAGRDTMTVNKMKPLRKLLAGLILAGAFARSTVAQPVVTTVVNKASYNAVLSPNSWVVVAGYNFAASSVTAPAGSPPTT